MLAIVIPTLNEKQNIALLLPTLLEIVPSAHIIVVDDSSSDGTQQCVEEFSKSHSTVHLLKRSGEKNFARSYCEGFEKAFSLGAAEIIQMDSDFSHNPSVVPLLVEGLRSDDVVIGSRYVAGGKTAKWPFWRRWLSKGGNVYASWMTGIPLNDSTSGFVGWRRATLESILATPIASNGYVFQVELKYRAWRSGASLGEIPIIFVERENGVSKMSSSIVTEAITSLATLSSRTKKRVPAPRSSNGKANKK